MFIKIRQIKALSDDAKRNGHKVFPSQKKKRASSKKKEKKGKELNLENAFGILLVRFRVRTSTVRRLQEFSREIGENQNKKTQAKLATRVYILISLRTNS